MRHIASHKFGMSFACVSLWFRNFLSKTTEINNEIKHYTNEINLK